MYCQQIDDQGVGDAGTQRLAHGDGILCPERKEEIGTEEEGEEQQYILGPDFDRDKGGQKQSGDGYSRDGGVPEGEGDVVEDDIEYRPEY